MTDLAVSTANDKSRARPLTALLETLGSFAALGQRALLFAFSLAGGALAYFALAMEPPLWVAIAGAVLSGLGFALARRYSTHLVTSALALVLFAATLGFAAASFRAHAVQGPQIRDEMKAVMVEGWVTEVEPAAKGVRLRIDVHAISRLAPEDTPKSVRLTHGQRLEVSSGRFVRCYAVLRPPPQAELAGDFDFRRQAWFQQLGAVGYVQGRCRGGALGKPDGFAQQVGLKISALRRNFGLHIKSVAGERAGGFAAAMVTGDRSLMSAEDQETLRQSGLSHLLAVSGLNMAIAGGLIFFLVYRVLALIEPLALRVAVKRPAALVALMTTTAYFVVSGMSVPAQRAFIMCVIVFGAVVFDRAAINLRSFALSMSVIVLLQPESVVAPGFQMSFAATGALVAIYEIWSERRRSRDRVMGPIAFSFVSLPVTSIVAGFATLPFSLYHFDRQATLGLLANFLAMPIISYVSAPAAALALLLAPFGESDIGLRLFGWSLEGVLEVAERTAAIDPVGLSPTKPMPGATLALVSLAMGLSVLVRGVWWAKSLIIGVVLMTSGAVWRAAPDFVMHLSASGDVFVARPEGTIERYPLTNGDGLAPLRYSRVEPAPHCANTSCAISSRAGSVLVLRSLNQAACTKFKPISTLIVPAPTAKDTAPEPVLLPTSAACGRIYIAGDDAITIRAITEPVPRLTETRPAPCGNRIWRGCG